MWLYEMVMHGVSTPQAVYPLPPLGHIWDVMLVWLKGNVNKNCLCVTVLCTIIMVHKGTSSSCRSVNCIGLWSCLVQLSIFQAPLCLLSSWWYIDIKISFCWHPSLCLSVSWAWWDWPFTWLTNHRPSVLWHSWLGHSIRKIVSEMTYNVSSGTLNSTIPYLSKL